MNNTEPRKKIVVCGDSFAIGIGCVELHKDSFGALLSRELGLDLVNLAKGSSTHFSIRLQALYAVEKFSDMDLLIVGNTSYDRTEWFSTGTPSSVIVNNESVNYHQYPPYGENSYKTLYEHPLAKDENYTGEMLTENYRGIVDYVETYLNHDKYSGYYQRFNTESPEKMRLLYEYYKNIHDDKIQKWYDVGIVALTHLYLKKKGVRHLILNDDPECLDFIDPLNQCNVSWGKLALQYPDSLKTKHTSENGHYVAFTTVMNKLRSNGWI